ncbi:hypothetical protein GE09DRAFT_1265453 [Coniochaeta sp. 2T2.1]|nr:hypothetical protein GE09DRAFT_1265453 [Coniochaeta sp. 2T2.1]
MSNWPYAQPRPPWLGSRESPFQQYRRQEATSYQQSNHRYYDYQNDDYPEARYKEGEYHDDGYQSNACPYDASQRNASHRGNAYHGNANRGNAYRGNAYQDEGYVEPTSAAPSYNCRSYNTSTVHVRPPTCGRVPTSNAPRDNYHAYGNPTRRVGVHADTRHNIRLTNESPRNNAPESPTTYRPVQSKAAKQYRTPTSVNNTHGEDETDGPVLSDTGSHNTSMQQPSNSNRATVKPASNAGNSVKQSPDLSKSGRPWIPSDDDLLGSLVRAGKTPREAAVILKRSVKEEATIEADRRWKQCEDDLLRSLLRAGKTREEAAEILERTIKEIDARNTLLVRKEKGASSPSSQGPNSTTQAVRSWTTSDDQRLLAFARGDKTTQEEAAKLLGWTAEDVKERYAQLEPKSNNTSPVSATTKDPVSNASASAPTGRGTPTVKTASTANTAPTNTAPATSALAKSAPTKLGPKNDKAGPSNSSGGTKPNTRVGPVWVGGNHSDREDDTRSVDEEEKQFPEQRRQEEFMVLSRQYTLPPGFYDKVKADRQFSRLDCKLLALLEQKHTNTNKWADIQVDFLGSTGRLVRVQELRHAFQRGPGNYFSAQENKTLSFLHNKHEHDKWRAIEAEFNTGTGRLVDVELLKHKLGVKPPVKLPSASVSIFFIKMDRHLIILDKEYKGRQIKLVNLGEDPRVYWCEPYEPSSLSPREKALPRVFIKRRMLEDYKFTLIGDTREARGHYRCEPVEPAKENITATTKNNNKENRAPKSVTTTAKATTAVSGTSSASHIKPNSNNVNKHGPGSSANNRPKATNKDPSMTSAKTSGPSNVSTTFKLDHIKKRDQEEKLVSQLLQESTLSQVDLYRLTPTEQFSTLDCKLLVLLDEKHGKAQNWRNLQDEFFKATGKLFDTKLIQDMVAEAQRTTGPVGNYSTADCRMVAYLKDKITHDVWMAVKQDFLAVTGRIIEIDTLKDMFAMAGK